MKRFNLKYITLTIALLFLLAGNASADINIKQAICDINVMCLAGDEEKIDWASIYHLNDKYGCRIDIVKLHKGSVYDYNQMKIPGYEIYFHKFHLKITDEKMKENVADELFSTRHPDIVIFGLSTEDPLFDYLRGYILKITPTTEHQFNILKIFEQVELVDQTSDNANQIILNVNELAKEYELRMQYEIPALGINFSPYEKSTRELVRYNLIYDQSAASGTGNGILVNIPNNRLESIFDNLLPAGPKKITYKRQTRNLLTFLNSARRAQGKEQVDLILKGYRSLLDIMSSVERDTVFERKKDLPYYFDDFKRRIQHIAEKGVGIEWDGKILLRDSPHGTRLKFRASLSANGPQEIELQNIKFFPYWENEAIVIDSQVKVIDPHQSYIREYLIEIDRKYLEAKETDSLVFEASLQYGPIPLTVRNTIPIWERPDLGISFEPNFYFIPSPAELEIDRVVSSRTIRAIITKPTDYSDTLEMEFSTPTGLFAGAYNKTLIMNSGSTHETIRIPFSISKLFELGIQQFYLTLSKSNNILAEDTGLVRIASCKIDDKIKIGFVPDTSGMLEDILQMTEATYRPFTERGLLTSDLEAYNVIVIGSGAFRHYKSLTKMKERFSEFLRHGGSLVVMGQPEDWPEDMLPVILSPVQEFVTKDQITTRIEQANILTRPYKISKRNLFSSFFKEREVASAVVAPAEKVFVTESGATLLSVSRMGEGQIIYCGLPLLDLISKLDIDAIHLFANILNY